MNRRVDPVDVVFHGGCAVTVAAVVVLQLLRRPGSRLSRWVDRQIDQAVAIPSGGMG